MHASSTLRCWSLAAFWLVWCTVIVVPVAAYTLPAGVFPWFGPKTAVLDVNVAPLVPEDETYHQKQFRAVVRDMQDFRIMRGSWDVCKNDTGIQLWYANHADKEQKTIEHYAKIFRGENVTELILSLQRNLTALQEQIRNNNASHAQILKEIAASTGLIAELKSMGLRLVSAVAWAAGEGAFYGTIVVTLLGVGLYATWVCGITIWTNCKNPKLFARKLCLCCKERIDAESDALEKAELAEVERREAALKARRAHRQSSSNSTATPTGPTDGVSSLASQTSTLTLGSPRTVLGECDSESDEETQPRQREGAPTSSMNGWYAKYKAEMRSFAPPGGM